MMGALRDFLKNEMSPLLLATPATVATSVATPAGEVAGVATVASSNRVNSENEGRDGAPVSLPLADDYEERAAVAEFDGNLPRPIAEGVARLQTMRPLLGFSPVRWLGLVDGACRFADRWAHRALALGWTQTELFGVHPLAPGARIDCRGLALVLAEADVIAMDERLAVIRPHAGGEQRFRRSAENFGAQLIWNLNEHDADASEGN